MDNGPQASDELIWLLGHQLDDELLDGLTKAIDAGYVDWIVIPGAPMRVSTVIPAAGTFVP